MKIQALQLLPAQYPGYAVFYPMASVIEVRNADTVRITGAIPIAGQPRR